MLTVCQRLKTTLSVDTPCLLYDCLYFLFGDPLFTHHPRRLEDEQSRRDNGNQPRYKAPQRSVKFNVCVSFSCFTTHVQVEPNVRHTQNTTVQMTQLTREFLFGSLLGLISSSAKNSQTPESLHREITALLA